MKEKNCVIFYVAFGGACTLTYSAHACLHILSLTKFFFVLFFSLTGYLTSTNPYFGATVGRVANRVANGSFSLPNGQQIRVSRNWNEKHQLHGGFRGFDKAVWEVTESGMRQDGISMQHCSPDGHEGYPGEVRAVVHFTLTEDNCLHVDMQAQTTEMTAVNMTNHSYFNLAGHVSIKWNRIELKLYVRGVLAHMKVLLKIKLKLQGDGQKNQAGLKVACYKF